MWALLRSFIWLDRCLQENMTARGWNSLSRTESQMMILVAAGITRPIEISKALDLSRQAINQTTKNLVERGLIQVVPDPDDRRCKVLTFAPTGEAMRKDARATMELMDRELVARLGEKTMGALYEAIDRDWGDTPVFDPKIQETEASPAPKRKRAKKRAAR